MHFIRNEEGEFQKGDYKRIASVERIRNISDYDDFDIADKKECEEVVRFAKEMYEKTLHYIKPMDEFSSHIVEVLEENHLVNKEEVIMEIDLYLLKNESLKLWKEELFLL